MLICSEFQFVFIGWLLAFFSDSSSSVLCLSVGRLVVGIAPNLF